MNRSICPDITPTRLSKETESINMPPIDAQGAQNGPADPQCAPSYTLQTSPPPSYADPSSGEINATTLQGQPSTPPRRQTAPPTCASPSDRVHHRDSAAPVGMPTIEHRHHHQPLPASFCSIDDAPRRESDVKRRRRPFRTNRM
jgi:hypothetical protein